MSRVPDPAELIGLLKRPAGRSTLRTALDPVLPLLVTFAHARAVLVDDVEDDSRTIAERPGGVPELDPSDLRLDSPSGEAVGWGSGAVPPTWTGVTQLAVYRMPRSLGALVFAWDEAPGDATVTWLQVMCALLGEHLARQRAEEELADLTARVDHAQQQANMGDYDWHIASDTNTWSDQLYRIYGHEPHAFNASYERFLSQIHPDDREQIQDIHARAYETGEPYEMTERIVRPDGEVRYLSSNGQVVRDENGTPVRMRGTCVDVTDRVLAEQARERLAARFRSLVESCPDAILVLDAAGTIVQANRVAHHLLGGDPVGTAAVTISPGLCTAGQDVPARALDGQMRELDVTVSDLHDVDGEGMVAVYLRDASVRHADEARAAALREAQVRHRQAQEINDDVVQGLTAAIFAMEAGSSSSAVSYLEQTLTAARRLMNDWTGGSDGGSVRPGSLVRTLASALPRPLSPVAEAGPLGPEQGSVRRILVVDDNQDVRKLLCAQLESLGKGTVVGEAGDGQEAVRLAAQLQPDLVFLDLSMPAMDGLEALPHILDAVPGVKVIVMSGFDRRSVAQQVLDSGAAGYVEKGLRMNLGAVIDEIYQAA